MVEVCPLLSRPQPHDFGFSLLESQRGGHDSPPSVGGRVPQIAGTERGTRQV